MKKNIKFYVFALLFIMCFNIASAVEIDSKYGILYDYTNKEILFAKDMNTINPPSSMTKLMVAYITFEQLATRKLKLDDKFKVSIRAWRQDGSRMFLEPEWRISIDELLRGLLTVSGNDASIVLAEGISGNIDEFVNLMNSTALKLGMKDTHFANPSGLYDSKHFSTMKDLTILISAILDKYKPYYDRYFALKEYSFNNIKQKNRNVLLGVYDGLDGVKTGHTDEGGYGLASSSERKGLRLIAIVNGGNSEKMRANDTIKLLEYGFLQYQYLDLYKANQPIINLNNVVGNINDDIYLYSNKDIVYPVKRNRINELEVKVIYNTVNSNNIRAGEKAGILRIVDGEKITDYNLFASKNINKTSKLRRFFSYFKGNCAKIVFLDFKK